MHYFGHFEYEREPRTSVWNTPFPAFNVELSGKQTVKMGGIRVDYQLSPQMRMMGKYSEARVWQPFGTGSINHPAETGWHSDLNREYLGQFTQVLGTRAANEIRGGKTRYIFRDGNLTTWPNHWQRGIGVTTGAPRITFTGFSIGGNRFFPRHGAQDIWMIRDDFTFAYDLAGRHDLRAGGEFQRYIDDGNNCQSCMGIIDARNGPLPTAAQMQAWFPDPWNADTWNLAAISPLVRTYDIGIGDYTTHDIRPQIAAWVQDDWRLSQRLTLNLGVRYDLSKNASGNNYEIPNLHPAGQPDDTNNFQPRVGFAYQWNERTVVRGGSGLYFGVPLSVETFWVAQINRLRVLQFTNDNRSNFAADPLNGQPLPTLAQADQRFCHVQNAPGCLRLAIGELIAPGPVQPQPRAQLAELDRDPAAVWHHDGGGGRLRVHAGAPREGHPGEREPDVQPGDGRELSVLGRLAARAPAVRADLHVGAHRPIELSRAANVLHQAARQPLAGRGHLHAIRFEGRRVETVFRLGDGAVPNGARSWR